MRTQPSGAELVGQLREQPEKRTWLERRPRWALRRIAQALHISESDAIGAAALVDLILLIEWQRAAGAAPDPLASTLTQTVLWSQ